MFGMNGFDVLTLIIATVCGGICGYLIREIVMQISKGGHLQIVWNKLSKITEKVVKIEKTLHIEVRESDQNNRENSYKHPKINLQLIRDEIRDLADRLEKVSEQTKKNSPASIKNKSDEGDKESKVTETKTQENKDFSENKSQSGNSENVTSGGLFSDSNQPKPKPKESVLQSQNLPSQIKALYNNGINDRSARDLFWGTFKIIRIANGNAVAQRLGEASEPDFCEASNGEFLAVDGGNGFYYVVPLFDLTITSSAFNEGGVGYVFECINYDSQAARSILKINKPATFRCEGGKWSLTDGGKGELELLN